MNDTHSKAIGYILWIFGFMGAHRFYYGKTVSGIIWFFTLGLLLIGWIVDLFLIPSMDREADLKYTEGPKNYNVAWILLTFLGVFGIHQLLHGKDRHRDPLSAHGRPAVNGRGIRLRDPQ